MATIQRTLRLPAALNAAFEDHCRRARRDEPATLRSIIELFYADGVEAAERRLTTGVWDDGTPPRQLSDDAIEHIVTGSRSEKRRGRSA